MVLEIVHFEVAVRFEPVFMRIDSQVSDQMQAYLCVGEYPHVVSSKFDFPAEAFQHVGAFQVLMVLSGELM